MANHGRLWKSLDRYINRLMDLFFAFSGALVAFIMIIISYDVIMRSFNKPTMWVQEIAQISVLYILFLSFAAVSRTGRHVKIDAIFNKFKPCIRGFLDIIYSFICVIIGFVFLWYGSIVTIEAISKNLLQRTILELPLYPILIIIPIGGFLMVIQYSKETWQHIIKFRTSSIGSAGEDDDLSISSKRFVGDRQQKGAAATQDGK